jgi:hypothetical protein
MTTAAIPAAVLTQDQLAQSLQVSRHQIVRWRALGLPTITLPGYKGDRCLRFDVSDVLQWLKKESAVQSQLAVLKASPPPPDRFAAVPAARSRPQTRTRSKKKRGITLNLPTQP